MASRLEIIKLFMLNLTEHEIYSAHELQGQRGSINVIGLRFYKCYRVKEVL